MQDLQCALIAARKLGVFSRGLAIRASRAFAIRSRNSSVVCMLSLMCEVAMTGLDTGMTL